MAATAGPAHRRWPDRAVLSDRGATVRRLAGSRPKQAARRVWPPAASPGFSIVDAARSSVYKNNTRTFWAQSCPGNLVHAPHKARRRLSCGSPAAAADSLGEGFDFLELAALGKAAEGQVAERVMAVDRAGAARCAATGSSPCRLCVRVENEGAAALRFRLGMGRQFGAVWRPDRHVRHPLVNCRVRYILFGEKCQLSNYRAGLTWMRIGFSRRSIGPA